MGRQDGLEAQREVLAQSKLGKTGRRENERKPSEIRKTGKHGTANLFQRTASLWGTSVNS